MTRTSLFIAGNQTTGRSLRFHGNSVVSSRHEHRVLDHLSPFERARIRLAMAAAFRRNAFTKIFAVWTLVTF